MAVKIVPLISNTNEYGTFEISANVDDVTNELLSYHVKIPPGRRVVFADKKTGMRKTLTRSRNPRDTVYPAAPGQIVIFDAQGFSNLSVYAELSTVGD